MDTLATFTQNCNWLTHKEGALERIVQPPFLLGLGYSGSWTLTVSNSGYAYQGIPAELHMH